MFVSLLLYSKNSFDDMPGGSPVSNIHPSVLLLYITHRANGIVARGSYSSSGYGFINVDEYTKYVSPHPGI